MRLKGNRRNIPRGWFYVAVVVVVVSVWGVQTLKYDKIYNVSGKIFSGSTGGGPNEWDKMSVAAMTETNTQLTTLATALLGALGLLMINKVQAGSKWRHMWAAFLGAVGGGLSLYFGYGSHLYLLTMISNQAINPYDPVYIFWSHAQFYTLLAGAFFFADFAVHQLSEEKLT
jgi:hypothetical protein